MAHGNFTTEYDHIWNMESAEKYAFLISERNKTGNYSLNSRQLTILFPFSYS
jgi:hypothetical protein